MSVDRLIEAVARLKNPAVMGLDPRPSLVPPEIMGRHIDEKGETLEAAAGAFLEFNLGLLELAHGIIPAVKPQLACYEALGPAGMSALRDTLLRAREMGYYVIADAKRGDIGSTSKDYSAAYLGRVTIGSTRHEPFPADAMTVNPYLGSDNLNEFLEDCRLYDKMVFVLCKTSNKSSIELQELMAGDRPLYWVVAGQCERAGDALPGKNGYSSVGMVVGVTHPIQLRRLRERFPSAYFLVPGYGAQGGSADDAADAFDKYGRGALVNSSRGIIGAWQKRPETDWKDAARSAMEDMRDALRKAVPGGFV